MTDLTHGGSDHTATLTLEIEKQVIMIHSIDFVYHYEYVAYAPTSYESIPSGTFSSYSRSGSNLHQTWTAPGEGVTGTIVFTLSNKNRSIAFKQFTVTYDRIVWD